MIPAEAPGARDPFIRLEGGDVDLAANWKPGRVNERYFGVRA